jgi:hypothetical protein
MTFQKKHPLIHELIDELIQAARNEESMRIAMILDKSSATKLRKAQVRTRGKRKALVDQIKLTLARKDTHNPEDCPYLHIKDCPGCGRSCGCYKRSRNTVSQFSS